MKTDKEQSGIDQFISGKITAIYTIGSTSVVRILIEPKCIQIPVNSPSKMELNSVVELSSSFKIIENKRGGV